uniref:Uncharacterized protein n=1 Tax=Siphoviridae sp. ct03815 TaxID=2827759 RepID=A0A8S5TPR0_9CAUD|nr:MAG TPA: hypothetical protein [Siphoviridae sp. ct03815]
MKIRKAVIQNLPLRRRVKRLIFMSKHDRT